MSPAGRQDAHLALPLSLGLDAGRKVNLAAWRKNCQASYLPRAVTAKHRIR